MIDPTPHLERFASYQQACKDFRWHIPSRLNIANAICERHADRVSRIALSEAKEGGINTYTFGALHFLSDKFATALSELGIRSNDSVAVVMSPSAALAITHLGVLKAGAVVIPLAPNSDPSLVKVALADSDCRAIVADENATGVLHPILEQQSLDTRLIVKDLRSTAGITLYEDFWGVIDRCNSDFASVETNVDSPALAFYIERDGKIEEIVHSHRSIVTQFAAFEMFNAIEPDSVFWTTGDWSSTSDLTGMFYPALWYGCSVVAAGLNQQTQLEPCGVTNILIINNDNLEAQLEESQHPNWSATVRNVVVENSNSQEYFVVDDPRVSLNEVYGRPEFGWVFGKCPRLFPTAPGSVGRSVAGRSVEIIDGFGNICPPRTAGHIAIHKSDPGLIKPVGDWILMGAIGYKNEDGDLFITPSS